MLESFEFTRLADFAKTHSGLKSFQELHYTFQCEDLRLKQNVEIGIGMVYGLVLAAAAGRLIFLQLKRQLDSMHSWYVLTVMLLVLGLTSSTTNFFTYIYGRQCPWPLEKQGELSMLESARVFFHTVSKVFVIFISLAIAYGYDILYADVSAHILKVVLIMTPLRFMTLQIERSFSSFQFLLTAMIMLEVIYLMAVFLYVTGFCLANYRMIDNASWNLFRQSRRVDANQESLSILKN